LGHQGPRLDLLSLTASRGLSPEPSTDARGGLKSTRGRTGVIVCVWVRR